MKITIKFDEKKIIENDNYHFKAKCFNAQKYYLALNKETGKKEIMSGMELMHDIKNMFFNDITFDCYMEELDAFLNLAQAQMEFEDCKFQIFDLEITDELTN